MGIKYLNLSSFGQFQQYRIKVCCKVSLYKTVSGKVVAQSIAFRAVSIYWQGDDPLPLKSWLKVTYRILKKASFDTFRLVAPQPQEIEQEGQHALTGQRVPPISGGT